MQHLAIMSSHHARILWKLEGEDFRKGLYSREHEWTFDGGLTVPASPSPDVVRPPHSNPDHVDPEEAFVASISSCHMLWFLHLASEAGLEVLRYEDAAVGTMSRRERGVYWISHVELRPTITYAQGRAPEKQQSAHCTTKPIIDASSRIP